MSSQPEKNDGSANEPAATETAVFKPVQRDVLTQVATYDPGKAAKDNEVRYSDELADEIVALVRSGMTVKDLLLQPGMPSHSTFYRWRDKYINFETRIFNAVNSCVMEWEAYALESLDGVEDVSSRSRAKSELYQLQADRKRDHLNRMQVILERHRLEREAADAAANTLTNESDRAGLVIDGSFEVVETSIKATYEEAIKEFEKSTGVKTSVFKKEPLPEVEIKQ